MTKGTTSRGTRNDKTHILSRLNGRRCYHLQKKRNSRRGQVIQKWFYFLKINFYLKSVQLVEEGKKTSRSWHWAIPPPQGRQPTIPQRIPRGSPG